MSNCPVCFEDLNNSNSIITCWNNHKLCEYCYVETIKHKKAENNLDSNLTVELNNKCPECREEMFDWFGIELEYQYEKLKKDLIESNKERKKHYDWFIKYKKDYTKIFNKYNKLSITYRELENENKELKKDLEDLLPKCSNCGKSGHNRRTCMY